MCKTEIKNKAKYKYIKKKWVKQTIDNNVHKIEQTINFLFFEHLYKN